MSSISFTYSFLFFQAFPSISLQTRKQSLRSNVRAYLRPNKSQEFAEDPFQWLILEKRWEESSYKEVFLS